MLYVFIAAIIIVLLAVCYYKSTRLTPEELRALQQKLHAQKEALLDKLKEHELETIKIRLEKAESIAIRSSKVGGDPYWPKQQKYPQDEQGKGLYLLAQVNCDDFEGLDGYPESGMLQFFISEGGSYGMELYPKKETLLGDIQKMRGYRVIYHPSILEDDALLLSDFSFLNSDPDLPFTGKYAMAFEKSSELPGAIDYRFEQILGDAFSEADEEVLDELYDICDSTGHKIGGYAFFTQYDPRDSGTEEWELLLQIDTDDSGNADIMWGDAGVANFFIRKEDLKRKDFTKVWFSWDCG
jgi:uncharacterized protein YwqG